MKCFVTILRVSLVWSRTSRPIVCQPLSRHQRQSQHWYIRSKFGQVLLTTGGALVAAVSSKFNLIGKKEELNAAICELERIKKKVDYVVSCNGDFTENQFDKIIANC